MFLGLYRMPAELMIVMQTGHSMNQTEKSDVMQPICIANYFQRAVFPSFFDKLRECKSVHTNKPCVGAHAVLPLNKFRVTFGKPGLCFFKASCSRAFCVGGSHLSKAHTH